MHAQQEGQSALSTGTRTIASLALVKVLWDHLRHDYLEAFVPLVATILKAGEFTSLDDPDVHRLCREFEATFGLRLPYHPMIAILNRARKRGIVTRRQGRFLPVADKLAEVDLSAKTAAHTATLNDLLTTFTRFMKERYEREFTQQTAEDAFIGFLKEHDVDILFAAAELSALPEVKPSKDSRYLVASFIRHVQEHDAKLFSFIANVAVGHALASAMLYKGIERYSVKLRGVLVYCDTQFVLRLVGAEGDERKLAYYALVEALRSSEAELRVFGHTYDELMGILKSCRQWIRNPGFDPSKASPALLFFIQSGFTESDIDDFIVRADDFLRELGIKTVDSPAPSEFVDFQIDETKLRERIVSVYERSRPFDEVGKAYTLDRDIKSIAAVNKLRRGRRPVSLKQCGHILVTTNSALAYANRRFEMGSGRNEDEVPTCVTDVFLGTTVWLHSPAVVSTINSTRLIAYCTTALRLDQGMLKKVAQVTTKLRSQGKVTEEEYYLLRASPVAHEMIAEKTLGDPNAFSAKTVDEILKEVTDKAKAAELERYRREKDDHFQTQVKLVASDVRYAKVGSRLHSLSTSVARLVANLVLVVLLLVAGVGFVLPFFSLVERFWIKAFAIIVAIAFGLGSLLYGFDLFSARDWVMRKVYSFVFKKLGGDHSEPSASGATVRAGAHENDQPVPANNQ